MSSGKLWGNDTVLPTKVGDGLVAIGLPYDPDDLLDTTRLTRFPFHEYSPH